MGKAQILKIKVFAIFKNILLLSPPILLAIALQLTGKNANDPALIIREHHRPTFQDSHHCTGRKGVMYWIVKCSSKHKLGRQSWFPSCMIRQVMVSFLVSTPIYNVELLCNRLLCKDILRVCKSSHTACVVTYNINSFGKVNNTDHRPSSCSWWLLC